MAESKTKTWVVKLTFKAQEMLADISDRRIRQQIAGRIDGLAYDPEKQGKPLLGELSGYRSLKAAGQRFRIIYTLRHREVVVLVVGVGIRRERDRQDIYELARKLIKAGLIA